MTAEEYGIIQHRSFQPGDDIVLSSDDQYAG
jgi:hypothetical protein